MLGQLSMSRNWRLRRRRRWALLMLLWVPLAEAQQVYKWTDAQGTVHYSEQKPAAQAKVLILKHDASAETPEQAVAEAARAQAEGRPALDRAEQAQRTRMCAKARDNLKLLDSPAIVLGSADPHTATQLSGEQREAARDEARQQIRTYCDE
jgi:hypothetical protein